MTIANAQQAPVAGGGEASGTGGKASYSISQLTNYAYTSTNAILIEGVQQPKEISNVLPITLLYFKGETAGKIVNLTWATVNEINNSFFTIERTKNRLDFSALTSVPTKGNNYGTQNYFSIDEKPYEGISYYRLKQTDIDGKFTYSNVVAVKMSDNAEIEVYPNPTTDIVTLNIIKGDKELRYTIFDVQGKQVMQQQIISTSTLIDITNLPTNIYLLQIKQNDTVIQTFKIIKK